MSSLPRSTYMNMLSWYSGDKNMMQPYKMEEDPDGTSQQVAVIMTGKVYREAGLKYSKHPSVEGMLYDKLCQIGKHKLRDDVRKLAVGIALNVADKEFKPTVAWLDDFMRRFCLSKKTMGFHSSAMLKQKGARKQAEIKPVTSSNVESMSQQDVFSVLGLSTSDDPDPDRKDSEISGRQNGATQCSESVENETNSEIEEKGSVRKMSNKGTSNEANHVDNNASTSEDAQQPVDTPCIDEVSAMVEGKDSEKTDACDGKIKSSDLNEKEGDSEKDEVVVLDDSGEETTDVQTDTKKEAESKIGKISIKKLEDLCVVGGNKDEEDSGKNANDSNDESGSGSTSEDESESKSEEDEETSSNDEEGNNSSQEQTSHEIQYSKAENKYYKKNIDALKKKLEGSVMKCTSCYEQVNHHMSSLVYTHPALGLFICKKCYKYYGKGKFRKDKEGYDEYCRLCAEGGDLLCCEQDNCFNGFCKRCIKRTMGRAELKHAETTDGWLCYVCDPAPLMELRALHRMVLDNLKSSSDEDATLSRKALKLKTLKNKFESLKQMRQMKSQKEDQKKEPPKEKSKTKKSNSKVTNKDNEEPTKKSSEKTDTEEDESKKACPVLTSAMNEMQGMLSKCLENIKLIDSKWKKSKYSSEGTKKARYRVMKQLEAMKKNFEILQGEMMEKSRDEEAEEPDKKSKDEEPSVSDSKRKKTSEAKTEDTDRPKEKTDTKNPCIKEDQNAYSNDLSTEKDNETSEKGDEAKSISINNSEAAETVLLEEAAKDKVVNAVESYEEYSQDSSKGGLSSNEEHSLPDLVDVIKEVISDPDDPMDVDEKMTMIKSLDMENEVPELLSDITQKAKTSQSEPSNPKGSISTRRLRSSSSDELKSDGNAEAASGKDQKSSQQHKRRKLNADGDDDEGSDVNGTGGNDSERERGQDKDIDNNDSEKEKTSKRRQRKDKKVTDKDGDEETEEEKNIKDVKKVVKKEEGDGKGPSEGNETDQETEKIRENDSSAEEETAGKKKKKRKDESNGARTSRRSLRSRSAAATDANDEKRTQSGKKTETRKKRKKRHEDKEGDILLGLVSHSETSEEEEEEDEETQKQSEEESKDQKKNLKKVKKETSGSENEEKKTNKRDRKYRSSVEVKKEEDLEAEEDKESSKRVANGITGKGKDIKLKKEDNTDAMKTECDSSEAENEKAKDVLLNSEEEEEDESKSSGKKEQKKTRMKHQGKSKGKGNSESKDDEETQKQSDDSKECSDKPKRKGKIDEENEDEEDLKQMSNGVADKDSDIESQSKRKDKTPTKRKGNSAEMKNRKAKLAILRSDSEDDEMEDKPKPRSKKKEYRRRLAKQRRGKCHRKINMEDVEALQGKQLKAKCEVKVEVLHDKINKKLEEEEFIYASDYPDLNYQTLPRLTSDTDGCEADEEDSDKEFSKLMKSTDAKIKTRKTAKPKSKRSDNEEDEENTEDEHSDKNDKEKVEGKDKKKEKVNKKKEGLLDININDDDEEGNEDEETEEGAKKNIKDESITLNEKMKKYILMSSDEEADEEEDDEESRDISKELEEEAEREKKKHEKKKEKEMAKKKAGSGEDSEEEDVPKVHKKGYVNLNISTDEEDEQQEKKKGEEKEDEEDEEPEPESAYEDDSDFEESPRKRRLFQISSSESEDGGGGGRNKKKAKRKETSEEESEEDEEPKSKRKRIRKMSSSSNDDEDEDDEPAEGNKDSPSKHKKIRKVMKDEDLMQTTKNATQEEEDRRKRIEDRQKQYNEIFMIDVETDQKDLDKLVLDFDTNTKEELVSVHEKLVKLLKPHQFKGIKFMWDATVESIEQLKTKQGGGCILAHSMGLGKTLQVITLCHTLLTNKKVSREIQRILVCCPVNTIFNWVAEFNSWLKGRMLPFDVIELASAKDLWGRAYRLDDWWKEGGICVIGYSMFRNLSNSKNKRYKGKMKEIFQKTLLEPGPDVVVCDEGHMLKNEKTALSVAINKIRTKRRIILTGTPLQNNLKEYHCMIQFVKPNLLGTKKEFMNRFANPIEQGQCVEAMPRDVRRMKRRAHILHNLLEGCVQRYDYTVLKPYLPPKFEYVISVQLSEIQRKLYQYYLDNLARGGPKRQGSGLFVDFGALSRVWTHPKVLELAMRRAAYDDDEEEMDDFICDDTTSSESSDDERSRKKKSKKKDKESEEEEASEAEAEKPDPITGLTESGKVRMDWWRKIVIDTAGEDFEDEEYMDKLEHGGKIILLLDILRECCSIGDKVLLFSQSLLTLDLIEGVLQAVDQGELEMPTFEDSLPMPYKNWKIERDYLRLDGSTPADARKTMCRIFNNKDNERCRLFLISTRAGGLGINLVGANRVIIFDSSWNPSHDTQSIFRVYRFGQTKPCYIYRFVAQGTMEEKIYSRQVAKMSTALRVVDEHQIKRYFKMEELAQLYEFNPADNDVRETPIVPKDRLLAELLQRQKDWIVTYHEHESLLENQTSEELSEEERKAAWEDYENEKKGFMVQNHRVMPVMGAQTINHPGLPALSLSTFSFEGVVNTIKAQNPNLTPMELCESVLLATKQIQKVHLNHYQRVQAMVYNLKNPMIAPEQRKLLPFGNHPEMLPMLEQQLRLLEENITRENQVITHIDQGTTQRNNLLSAANLMSAGLVRGQPTSSGMSSATANYVERPSSSVSVRPSTSQADISQEQRIGSNDVVLLD